MEFLLFNEVLKNLIFFWSPVKKVASMTLILSKFQSLNVVFPDEVLSLSLSLSLVNINFEENHSGQLIMGWEFILGYLSKKENNKLN